MSDMKDMLIEVVEKIFKDQVEKETVDLLEEGKWAENIWDILADNEMIRVAIKEKNGGAGGDFEDLFNLYRLVGKYAVPVPFIEHTLANVILEYVNEKPVDRLVTVHLNEVCLDVSNERISGTLPFVPWARYAENLVCIAKENDTNHVILVDLREATIKPGVNLAGEPRDQVIFNNCPVLVKVEVSENQTEYLSKLVSAVTVCKMSGAIDKAFELSVQFSKEREQFGQPIHRFQLVQQHLAKLAGERALMATAVDNMIAVLNDGTLSDEVAYARLKADESSKIVATSAHQVHAAIGMTHEHRLHHSTRRLWSWRDEDYTARYWEQELAKSLLNSNEDLWMQLTKQKNVLSSSELPTA